MHLRNGRNKPHRMLSVSSINTNLSFLVALHFLLFEPYLQALKFSLFQKKLNNVEVHFNVVQTFGRNSIAEKLPFIICAQLQKQTCKYLKKNHFSSLSFTRYHALKIVRSEIRTTKYLSFNIA